MATIVTPYISKINSIERELPNIAKQAVVDNSAEIVLLVKNQLSSGLNSFGNPLKWHSGTGFYKSSTQGFADEQGLSIPKTKGEAYNFQWTSDTFDSMGLFTTKIGEFDIFSVDGKKNLLESIYGKIFDLTEEHNQYVNIEIILPTLQQYILDNLVQI